DGDLLVLDGDRRTRWLDLRDLPEGLAVVSGGERGFLGLDVDPDYATNGRLALSWTAKKDGGTHSTLATFRTEPGSKPGSAPLVLDTVLFTVQQPWSNHDGGCVRFGPDGSLYLGLGDGGRAGDPLGSGQDLATPLGAMLRFDPDLPPPHVPPDNPFVGREGVRTEIFAYGLRNPWRFAFTPEGVIIAGDVGQDRFEEITSVPRGANLGWNVREGQACFAQDPCPGDFVDPWFVYGRADGISVTGGMVARSGGLAGRYVFGDFGSGQIWSVPLRADGTPAEAVRSHGRFTVQPSSFALDAEGAVLVVDFAQGRILEIGVAGG
ncbi:MAG: PQQ-dependent sugar dehydrogenase, partial [Myxococcales bacterium]|nr:PQQ-dependent sugar dehydrogenase [Myxococcales bacterium]